MREPLKGAGAGSKKRDRKKRERKGRKVHHEAERKVSKDYGEWGGGEGKEVDS